MPAIINDDLKGAAFSETLKRHGITDEYLAGKLKEELEAEETKFFADKGKVRDEKDVIAWGIRQKARMDAHKLKGDYPSEKVEHTVTLEDKLRAIHEKREKEEETDE